MRRISAFSTAHKRRLAVAEFCRQCAEEYGFENDAVGAAKYAKLTEDMAREGYVLPFLCEGCGPTGVDHEGSCVADCDKHHMTIEGGEMPRYRVTSMNSELALGDMDAETFNKFCETAADLAESVPMEFTVETIPADTQLEEE